MANNIGRPVPARKLKLDASRLLDGFGDPTAGMFVTGPQLNPNASAAVGQNNWRAAGDVADVNTSPGKTTMFSRLFNDKNLNQVAGKVNEAANAMSPFMSNIVNAFRRPPLPRRGKNFDYTALQKVNLSDERNKISTMYAATNRATDRNVDANTAEAVKAFNRGDEIAKISSVNEREQNMNTQISNQQAQMDAQVSAANTGLQNKYQDELVERQVAQQREQSANWANVGDKLMMIRNEKSKERTELSKARVLRSMYDKSGVLKRDNAIGQQWKAAGIPDPFGEDYKWLDEKKANGGMLMGPSIKDFIPRRKLSQGGTLPVSPKSEPEVIPEPVPDPLAEERKFYQSYIKSPKYRERLLKQGYVDPAQVQADRLQRVNTTQYTTVPAGSGSSFVAQNNTIEYDRTEDKKYGLNPRSTLQHEMAHAAGGHGTQRFVDLKMLSNLTM
ncbi:MAG TPA: hypothetical protein V6C65_09110, partial [Allocoleopsis sp.]